MKRYEKLLAKENRKFSRDYNGQFGDMEFGIGRCQFCGHPIKVGYRLKDQDGNLLIVGSKCLPTLLNLDEEKKRIFMRQDKIRRQIYKYRNVLDFLKKKYDMIPHWEKELLEYKQYDGFVRIEIYDDRVKFIFKNFSSYRERDNDYLVATKKDIGYKVANEITRKIMTTTNINKWWFEEYKRITGIDLLELVEYKKNKKEG